MNRVSPCASPRRVSCILFIHMHLLNLSEYILRYYFFDIDSGLRLPYLSPTADYFLRSSRCYLDMFPAYKSLGFDGCYGLLLDLYIAANFKFDQCLVIFIKPYALYPTYIHPCYLNIGTW